MPLNLEWRWPNFKPNELACRDGTPFPLDDPMALAFLDKLQKLRIAMNFPFILNSVFRTVNYNASIGGASESAHTLARAADIAVYGERAFKIVSNASAFGFTGIGVNQKGPHTGRFVHLDDMSGVQRPMIWSY